MNGPIARAVRPTSKHNTSTRNTLNTVVRLVFNNLTTYTGAVETTTGEQLHDQLQTSYNKVNVTIPYIDPAGASWNVHFTDMVEELVDVRSQVDGLQWYLHITLLEA